MAVNPPNHAGRVQNEGQVEGTRVRQRSRARTLWVFEVMISSLEQ